MSIMKAILSAIGWSFVIGVVMYLAAIVLAWQFVFGSFREPETDAQVGWGEEF